MGLVNYIEVSARPDCIACRVSFPFSLPPFLLAAAAEKARVGVQLGVQLGARQEDEAEEESVSSRILRGKTTRFRVIPGRPALLGWRGDPCPSRRGGGVEREGV